MSESLERLSSLLQDVNVVLGLTGSVAVYRVVDVVRILRRHGADVRVVATREALKYVTKRLLEWASGREVHTRFGSEPMHVKLSDWCHVYAVAPCTFNTLCKIANGIADNLVTLTAQCVLGSGKPLLLVPCMSLSMWNSPILRRALDVLGSVPNVHILKPDIAEGRAKFPSINRIVEKIVDLAEPRDMIGLRVLVTAGATREYVDPIKYFTTPSSGLTGVYFAREAYARGAEVHLVLGYCSEQAREVLQDTEIRVHQVKTTEEMYLKVRELCKNYSFDIGIFSAAPLDYQLDKKFSKKIDTDSTRELTLVLKLAPKVIEAADNVKVKVGFKAEWDVPQDELIRKAELRMMQYDLDLVVAHDVSQGLGFGTTHDSVLLISRLGIVEKLERVHKRELARRVLSRAVSLLR